MMNILNVYSFLNIIYFFKIIDDDKNDWFLMIILIGIFEFIVCFLFFMMYIYCKKRSEFFCNICIY